MKAKVGVLGKVTKQKITDEEIKMLQRLNHNYNSISGGENNEDEEINSMIEE